MQRMHRPSFISMERPLRTVRREKIENGGARVAAAVGVGIIITRGRGREKRVGDPSRISAGFSEVAAFGVGFEV